MTKNLQNKLNDTRLQVRIGHQFQQADLLKLALTHRSVSHKHNYERLEFLGDSLLGMIVANYLYNTYPLENEGRLTRMRATLVRQEALGKIANCQSIVTWHYSESGKEHFPIVGELFLPQLWTKNKKKLNFFATDKCIRH